MLCYAGLRQSGGLTQLRCERVAVLRRPGQRLPVSTSRAALVPMRGRGPFPPRRLAASGAELGAQLLV